MVAATAEWIRPAPLNQNGPAYAGPSGKRFALDRPELRWLIIRRVFERIGKQRPILLCMDDLHHAWSTTIDGLAALHRDAPRLGLLVVATIRSEAVQADPATWRLVLMPPEGAPEILRERIASGRAAVVSQLAEVIGAGVGPGPESPDPELTARMLSAISDETARLVLTDPERYPPERVLAHARWWLEQLPAA